MEWTDYAGYAGAALTAVNFLPQVIKAWKTKDVADISYWMLILVIAAQSVWLVYAYALSLVPVLISNACLLLMALILLWFKYKFGRKNKKA
ncbi:MAG: hypothetical protein JWN76_1640 [Chitinophagaceae bacterium]|nr:hypothetical protein [Chitinophagaceae bacterium]